MQHLSSKLNFALPDGHLMSHVLPFIKEAGINFKGYEKSDLNPRPEMKTQSEKAKQLIKQPELVFTKVIRPQDMPIHVANGNFDIAISGTDWLYEHKLQFPKSPVTNLLGLGFGNVKIVAAVHESMGTDLTDFMQSFRSTSKYKPLIIASEYVYIADDYAQKNNLHPYRIIMTYGATESLIPEDCDMIIENSETGNTLRKNNLKIIDTLEVFEASKSEACLIGNENSVCVPWKKGLIQNFVKLFSR